jgi:hypothetical protein
MRVLLTHFYSADGARMIGVCLFKVKETVLC